MPISTQNLTNAQDEIIVESFKCEMTGSDLRENVKFSHQNDHKDPGFLNPSVDFDNTHDKAVLRRFKRESQAHLQYFL